MKSQIWQMKHVRLSGTVFGYTKLMDLVTSDALSEVAVVEAVEGKHGTIFMVNLREHAHALERNATEVPADCAAQDGAVARPMLPLETLLQGPQQGPPRKHSRKPIRG